MSLNMYLGEVRAQTQSMNAFCAATIQGMEQAINSIDAFVGDTVLQGQTYDSAKAFFAQTFRPLAQGIIYLCEELILQNDAFPSDFQSQVASTDVIEQEILEQIREIERTKAGIEVISKTLPGMQVMVGIFDAMKRKLQEKLEHLHEFNYTSSSNYDTALQLAASIAQGLAEVQSGKGFNAASGTFHIEKLNMEWAKPIQAITEDKIRQAEKESKKDESLLDKFKDAVEDGAEVLDQASEKIIHTIENTPILGQHYNYKKGQHEAVIDELKGLVNTVLHPIDSFENAMYALSHPKETFNAVKQAISDSWNQEVVNGDWNSRARWFGNVSAQATLAVAQLAVGTKGVDKISKISKVSKVDKASKINESVNFIQSVKNVLNSDKYRKFIDRLNNILVPKNELSKGKDTVDARFTYKNNPMDNPKAVKDILENPDAVYGFSPNPKSESIGGYADAIDWADSEQVAQATARRQSYHDKNDNIVELVNKMKNEGYSIEDIARAVNNQRNQNRLNDYIDDPKGLERVMARNEAKYGNPYGPSAEFSYNKYGSWEKVIEKSMSANPGMDACCGLYDKYYHLYEVESE